MADLQPADLEYGAISGQHWLIFSHYFTITVQKLDKSTAEQATAQTRLPQGLFTLKTGVTRRSGKGNRVAYIVHPGDIIQQPFETEAKPGMGHTAVAPQIPIPP